MSTIINIGIVDDHQLIIDGLKALLDKNSEIKIVFSTTDPVTVIEKIKQHPIHLLITDVMMPVLPGNKLAKLVKEQFPEIKILALSMSGEGDLVNEMINDADISGYALKNIGQAEFIQGIQKIMGGGIFFSEEVLLEMGKSNARTKEKEQAHLTIRELEVIRLIEQEYNNDQIAEQLFISKRTVETHRKNIFRKTKTNSILGIVKYVYENNLL